MAKYEVGKQYIFETIEIRQTATISRFATTFAIPIVSIIS